VRGERRPRAPGEAGGADPRPERDTAEPRGRGQERLVNGQRQGGAALGALALTAKAQLQYVSGDKDRGGFRGTEEPHLETETESAQALKHGAEMRRGRSSSRYSAGGGGPQGL